MRSRGNWSSPATGWNGSATLIRQPGSQLDAPMLGWEGLLDRITIEDVALHTDSMPIPERMAEVAAIASKHLA